MPKCSLKNCKNITSKILKKDGISYFRFPRDPIKCAEWTTIVGQQRCEENFKPNSSSVVCSEHFLDKDMYVTSQGIKRIRKTAVPSILIAIPVKDKKKVESPDTSLDIESMLETPQNVGMKNELEKCRKKLRRKNNKIKNLRKKYTKLLKASILLRNAVKVPRKSICLNNTT
ncbi:THAP domain-containing protein 1-like [Colias croceus]|uniref:THAP domain-containing protein 1-like n=1 Tax=Colias crocea TaxID=72248 RepID=UPI001E27FA33|nr:THAP domain-containing protein 1-like [Colias croceus]